MKAVKVIVAMSAMLLYAGVVMAQDRCETPVPTTEGVVAGKSVKGADACEYLGIPYSAPPVGELRWKAPQPPAKRESVLKAVEFAPECTQIEMMPSYLMIGRKPNRKEDCLYLNIWRPKKDGKFPVMVWIHGGGLTSGSGSDAMYWGDRLASSKDVVVVTFNYRLGALGFLALKELSMEDSHASSGNYGLLDQVAALKWVQQNIASFGGDPDNVTIFGESAGGWSVCMLMASPLAKGLFHKAILQSGGCDMVRTMEQGFDDGAEFAQRLGCSGEDVVSCLRGKSDKEIVGAMQSWRGALSEMLTLKNREHIWAPHVDGWALKEVPIDSLRNGNYNQVPFMVGSNRDEAKLFLAAQNTRYRKVNDEEVRKIIADSLGEELMPEFEKLYPYKNYPRAIDAFADAKGDIMLGCKCFEAAEATAKYKATYYYRFDYDDNRAPLVLGAAHAFEIPFIFNSLDRSAFKLLYLAGMRKRAKPLIDVVMSYWTNFAKNGNPNGEGLPEWLIYSQEKKMRMYLDIPIRVAPADNVDRCTFWREHESILGR